MVSLLFVPVPRLLACWHDLGLFECCHNWFQCKQITFVVSLRFYILTKMILTVFSIAIFSLFFIYVLICVRTLRYYLLKKLLKLACRFCWLHQPFSKTQEQNPSFYHCRVFNHINYAIQDHKLVFKIYLCIAHPLNKDHCHLHKVKYIHPWNNQKDILAYTQKYKWMYIHEIRK